ncbi:helix-turn-helix transcriptional regulator [Nonomuraea sp. NPDC050394]|uniref:helix-turn-helix transcriptional regulator n=1 Tax=Nonomuraea sp. NPDC050394 TaxID=3364363 RepID=UPI00378938FB
MRDPSGRLLQLLSLLQTPREWSGTELADRLGVTPRTIRRDIDRLRELGYPVHATQGNTGGYRMGSGTAMPPLLLDDEEAVAIALGLRTVAAAPISGIADTVLRALAKVEQVLPARLRTKVSALAEAATTLPAAGPEIGPGLLADLAAACVAHEKIRFLYGRADGSTGRRLAEPHQLVAAGRRWYLVAYDLDRDAWRTFRLDRLSQLHQTGLRGPARRLPGDVDAAEWVMNTLAGRPGKTRARLLIHAPIDRAAAAIPAWQGALEPVDAHSCRLTTGADAPEYLACRIATLPLDYSLLDPPGLAPLLRAVGERAIRGSA